MSFASSRLVENLLGNNAGNPPGYYAARPKPCQTALEMLLFSPMAVENPEPKAENHSITNDNSSVTSRLAAYMLCHES